MLRSRCDTEVLPHLYEDHGPALAERLRGMFAVAVWDQDARRGVLIRDRLGIKPLYYAIVQDRVVFGSELKCVLASGLVSAELDPEAISAYLMLGYVPGAMTPLKDVRKLLPGERLVVEDGRYRLERWWDYPVPDSEGDTRTADEWAEIVLDKLDESVKMRLMSDVPLGAMLSGGLDSSLIVALMARHMTEPLETFAVGFAGEDSELPDARRVADALGANHHELEVELQSDPEYLRRLIWHLDEPLADLSSIGFLALCELAADHVTVALSGQGADELFGGYRKHRVASLAESWGRVPGALRGAGRGAAAARSRPRRPPRRRAAGPRSRRPPARLQRLRPRRPAAASCSAARWPSTPAPPSASCAARWPAPPAPRRSRPRSTWTRGSGWSTTCSPTSTAPRWRARSRSACRSSTTSWSSCARRSRPSTRSTASRASTSCAWRPRATCRTSC